MHIRYSHLVPTSCYNFPLQNDVGELSAFAYPKITSKNGVVGFSRKGKKQVYTNVYKYTSRLSAQKRGWNGVRLKSVGWPYGIRKDHYDIHEIFSGCKTAPVKHKKIPFKISSLTTLYSFCLTTDAVSSKEINILTDQINEIMETDPSLWLFLKRHSFMYLSCHLGH